MAILIYIEIVILANFLLKIGTMFDAACGLKLGKRVYMMIFVCSLLYTFFFTVTGLDIAPMGLLYGIFAAYLLSAAISDQQTENVYDYMHLIAGIAGIVLCACNRPGWECLVDFLLYAAVQLFFFSRYYGSADVLAFIVCSLFCAASGRTMISYVLQMGSTFALLAAVQLCKHNFNKKGNLKVPKPLLPYIAVTAMWFL